MIFDQISLARLHNQQITSSRFTSPQELVGYMGALQAQDYPMSKWAIGVRVPGITDKQIEDAINSGQIIRTHVLRPTWHLVSSADLPGMLALTSSRIKATARSRWKELGLDDETFKRSNSIIEKALAGKHLTREALGVELAKSIPLYGQRLVHLLFRAELDGLICSGSIQNKKQTYALLQERVPQPAGMSVDEALAQLTRRYFTSHGPATLQDFVWWSGHSVSDAKRGMEMVKTDLISETIDGQIYWFSSSFSGFETPVNSVFLLPAYDEFIISYRDRSAAITLPDQKKAISLNGLFRPVIVVNGKVAGIWKRTVKKDKLVIETDFFTSPDKATRLSVYEAATALGRFLELKAEVR